MVTLAVSEGRENSDQLRRKMSSDKSSVSQETPENSQWVKRKTGMHKCTDLAKQGANDIEDL